jgi:molecular chaperone GrpE
LAQKIQSTLSRVQAHLFKSDMNESPTPETTPAAPPLPAFQVISTERLTALETAAAQASGLNDKLLRTLADWDNSRKRTQKEKEDAVKYAAESFLEDLIPVIDNLEMGLLAATSGQDAKAIATGLQMVIGQFQQFLKSAGLEAIDATGKPFDPHLHEAMSEQETTDVAEGTVVAQTRKGYKLRERLLRAASVIVAKAPHA